MSVSTLIKSNIVELSAGKSVINQLAKEDYSKVVEPLFQSSVGAHYRHILDHYHCFFAGLGEGHIDYDKRSRDTRVENDAHFCLQTIDAVLDQLNRLHSTELPSGLSVSLKTNASQNEMALPSTLEREMVFLHGHTTHHYALIAAMLRVMGYQTDQAMGIAPSTVAYQQQAAQQ